MNPELKEMYYAWFEKNKNAFQSELGKIKAKNGQLYRERSGIYHRLRNTTDKEPLLARLEEIKSELSISTEDRIRNFYITQFITSISTELHYITTYKKNRFVKIPYYKNVIVNEDLLYYFLAKTVYGGLQKDDINDKKYAVMKDYLNRYLTDNQDNIDSDDNITISTINTYMSESTKIFSVSDFRKVVNGNNMTLKKS